MVSQRHQHWAQLFGVGKHKTLLPLSQGTSGRATEGLTHSWVSRGAAAVSAWKGFPKLGSWSAPGGPCSHSLPGPGLSQWYPWVSQALHDLPSLSAPSLFQAKSSSKTHPRAYRKKDWGCLKMWSHPCPLAVLETSRQGIPVHIPPLHKENTEGGKKNSLDDEIPKSSSHEKS